MPASSVPREDQVACDIGLLESAIARPRQLWVYGAVSDVVDLASLLILALARNHPFTQGNKRAGFVPGQAFLEYNGYQLTVPDSVDFADTMIRTIADPALDASFTAFSRRHTVAAP